MSWLSDRLKGAEKVVPAAIGGGLTGFLAGGPVGAVLGAGAGAMGASTASMAQREAVRKQEQQYGQHLQTLEEMYAPQKALQEQLTGLHQARLWQTMGGGIPEARAQYYPEGAEGQRGFEQGLGMWETMAGAKEQELGAASRRMLGGIRAGRQADIERLTSRLPGGRMQFGGAVSGHTLQNIMEAQGKYAPMELQARMMPEMGMQQWKAGQAQEALGGLGQLAGGGLPYNIPEPPTIMPDYSQAAMWSGLGQTMPYLMDYFNKPQQQQRQQPIFSGMGMRPTQPQTMMAPMSY